MKIRDKIILYADGELSGEEKISFEKEIRNSPELRKELELYYSFHNLIEETKNPELNSSYFISVLPEFRKRRENKYKEIGSFKLAYAFPLLSILFLIFIYFNNLQIQEAAQSEKDLSSQNLDLMDYSVDELLPSNLSSSERLNYTSKLNKMIGKELNISSDSTKFFLADQVIDYNTILDNITNEDADRVYSNLLNKKF